MDIAVTIHSFPIFLYSGSNSLKHFILYINLLDSKLGNFFSFRQLSLAMVQSRVSGKMVPCCPCHLSLVYQQQHQPHLSRFNVLCYQHFLAVNLKLTSVGAVLVFRIINISFNMD